MSSVLTPRFFGLLALWQLCGIAAMLAEPFLIPYVASIPMLLIILLLDYRSLVDVHRYKAKLHLFPQPELGSSAVLSIAVDTAGTTVGRFVRIEVAAPRIAALEFKRVRAVLQPLGGRPAVLGCELEASVRALGFYAIEALEVTVSSTLGLWTRQAEVRAPALRFRVVPPLHDISHQEFVEVLAQQPLLYQGSRVVVRGRERDEFHAVRKYQFPDSITQIDQKKTARYGQLMTRTYDSVFNRHLVLVLDLGRAMCGSLRGSSRHDYYISTCLALARNALESHDTVSLLAISQTLHLCIPRARSLSAFEPLLTGSGMLNPREEESNYKLINHHLPGIASQRSIVLILTDLTKPSVQEGLLESVAPLCSKHLTVVASLIDRDYDLNSRVSEFDRTSAGPETIADLLYAYWLTERLNLFRRKLVKLGGAAISVSEQHWVKAAVRLYGVLRSSLRA